MHSLLPRFIRLATAIPLCRSIKKYAFLCLLTIPSLLFAQKSTLKGIFTDENKTPLEAVSVSIVSLPDSNLLSFALTDSLGQFKKTTLPEGKVLVDVYTVGYMPFDTIVELVAKQTVDLGTIVLPPSTVGLAEVEIRAKATPIIVRNDTIIFNASSFYTREQTAVIDLLKELPGIEVDDEGNIKAQGKMVMNILVDGKPFFNGDQGTTTRVLPADAIKTIEVYNQTSKSADFSGVTDGVKEKTINLVLKEDRKKGWFGNANGSIGGSQVSDQRHALQGSANRFSPKYQMALVGNVNNLAQGASTGFQRTQSLSGDMGFHRPENNGSYFNYNFNRNNRRQINEVNRQVLADKGGFSTSEKSENWGQNQGHALNFSSSHHRDTTRMLSFNLNGSNSTQTNWNRDTSATFNDVGVLTNSGIRYKEDESKQQSMNFNLQWGHRFKGKKQRNVTFSPSVNWNKSTEKGKLNAFNRFFQTDTTQQQTDTTRQLNLGQSRNVQAVLQGEYTQSLGKGITFQVEYQYEGDWENAQIGIYNQVETREVLVDSLSSVFTNYIGVQELIANLEIEGKSWGFVPFFGGKQSRVRSTNSRLSQVPTNQSFRNPIGGFSWHKSLGENASIGGYFSAFTSQPSESQLQPVPDRSDPLNVHYGNPNLRPEQTYSFSGGYQRFYPVKQTTLYFDLEMGLVKDQIIQLITIDEKLVRHYRPGNMQGAWRSGFSGSFSRPINKTKGYFSARLSGQMSRGQAYLSERLNTNTQRTFQASTSAKYKLAKWMSWHTSLRYSENRVGYDLDKNYNQRFSTQEYDNTVTLRFPHKFVIMSGLNMTVNRGLAQGFNRTIPIWNMELSRQFLKNGALVINLKANDILNRNVGVQRSVSLNTIEDRKSVALSRYFLLSVQYTLRQI